MTLGSLYLRFIRNDFKQPIFLPSLFFPALRSAPHRAVTTLYYMRAICSSTQRLKIEQPHVCEMTSTESEMTTIHKLSRVAEITLN